MDKGKKKLNKKRVILIIVIAIIALTFGVFGRYIYKVQRDMYLTSKEFYFTSDLLDDYNSETINRRWNGKGTFNYSFNLFSYKNKELRVNYDVNYTVSCSTEDTDKIQCYIGDYDKHSNTSSGTILFSTLNVDKANRENINLYIVPVSSEGLQIGDKVTVSVTATGSAGYTKTLTGRVTFIITEQDEFRYEIEDEANSSYATLKLVNPKNADLETTLEFNPEEIRIDSNNKTYLQTLEENPTNIGTTQLENGGNYVSKMIFNLKQESSIIIKFYKMDKSQNYSHSYDDETEGIIKIRTQTRM